MTADRIETDTAAKALAHRLRDWGVPEPAQKARAFMDDLTARGWKPNLVAAARRPPRPDEECRTHAGEYAGICRCCAADRKAARDAEAEQSETVRHRSIQEALAAARAAIRATTEETK